MEKSTAKVNDMKKIITALGIFIILFITAGSILSNFSIGNLMIYALGFTLALWYNVPKNRLTSALKIIAASGFAVVFLMIGFIFFSADANKTDYTEDAAIVLGCAVTGERLSSPLKYRLDTAYDYYMRNPDAVIIVSGGQGPQEDISEGKAMFLYLTSLGVPDDRIIVEDKATSTNENYIYSKAILDELFGGQAYKCVYITNRFHTYRAGRLAKMNGLDASSCSAPIGPMAATTSYMREVLAVFKLWLIGR